MAHPTSGVYSVKTSNLLDQPLAVASVFSPYFGNNGYDWTGVQTVYIHSVSDGALTNYNEASSGLAASSIGLVTPVAQELTLAYNKWMIARVQTTQTQDLSVSGFVKKWSVQQLKRVFVPAHDVYSIAAVIAARPGANVVTVTPANFPDGTGTEKLHLKFATAVGKLLTNGSDASDLVAIVSDRFARNIKAEPGFSSDGAYTAFKNKYFLSVINGVTCVWAPDSYFPAGTFAVIADKNAVINVTPKMDPKGNGFKVIEDVPGFSGVEVQMRDRGDTFVLNKKVGNIATIEDVASTTTTTTTTTTT